MRRIAIIGGGASGLAAAVAATQKKESRSAFPSEAIQVTVFEKADRVGKSILASGNGRCNFSNSGIRADDYFNEAFVRQSFEELPPKKVRAFFEDIGLLWREEGEGRLYPLTNKASSVLDVLRFAAECSGVEIINGKTVYAVTPAKGRHLVSLDDDTASLFDAVILACGGNIARSVLPSTYAYRNTEPMLGPLRTDTHDIRGLNNLRVLCSVNGKSRTERGEVLFRDYGISGIAVFNLSRFVKQGDVVSLDFFPDSKQAELEAMLGRRFDRMGDRSAIMCCAGMLQQPLARAVLRKAAIDAEKPIPDSAIAPLAQVLKKFPLKVQGIEDHRQCQVRRGGFAVEGFNPKTLESKADAGLFVVGEALDIDGPCGGFNLHWAWTSGIIAGRSAISCSQSISSGCP